MSNAAAAVPAGHVVEDQSEVFAFLADPKTHGLDAPVVRIDTHGAAVFLAGEHAYKVKRAVRFPFMDFSTLEKRRAACENELAVNRPNAPGLYPGTVAITRSGDALSLGGPGEVVEWAVHMRRFDESMTLDRVAARDGLTPDLLRRLVRAILDSHARAPLGDGRAATASLERYLRENAAAYAEEPGLFPPGRARALTGAAEAALARVRDLLIVRGEAGWVRRCHGDLHLRNVVLIDGEPILFDAIEFDDAIATGDVLYDLAFLLMDLWEREFRAEANLVLNRYLWGSPSDVHLQGLAALPVFLSIRAAIRAKVVAAGLAHLDGERRARAAAEAGRYFAFAESFLDPAPPRLAAVGGLSGTGKSTLAAGLAVHLGRAPGAVHLRSDIERKRMFGVPETEPLPPQAYAPAVTDHVYARLRHQAAAALEAGQSVIVDAVHDRPDQRSTLRLLAERLKIRFDAIWLEAPPDILIGRVAARTGDASDADAAVVRRQAAYDPGAIDWSRLDASAGAGAVLQKALEVLNLRPEP